LFGLPNLVVVLVDPETPGNVGFTARVLANFGVQELRIVGTDPCEDEEARIYSVHAIDILESAEIFTSLENAIHDLDVAWAATARSGRNYSVTRAVVPLPQLPDPTALDGRVGLVFGRESSGLTNEEILLCDLAFLIPTSKAYPSMNLSHAVAVTLYDLYLKYGEKEPPRVTDAKPATRKEREQVYVFFDEIVDTLPLKDYKKPITKQVFRNLLGRSYLTGREVSTLTGLMRKTRDMINRGNDEE
jgi:TrmH family RNA methyltransferase